MCSICDRREFLAGALALAFPTAVFGQTRFPQFCAWSGSGLPDSEVRSSSGNKRIDDALIAEVKKILNVIPISPGFKFIQDTSPNAYALPRNLVPDTQGTILIGLSLIESEFHRADHGGIAVAGIVAHECAHVFQYQNGYMSHLSGPTQRLIELHADYVAGFYFGRDRSHPRTQVEVFAKSLFSKGDFDFNSKDHHGTPEERVKALRRGLDDGNKNLDFSTAAREGADYVRRL